MTNIWTLEFVVYFQLLTKASYTKGNMSLMPDFDTPREKLFVTPKQKRVRKAHVSGSLFYVQSLQFSEIISSFSTRMYLQSFAIFRLE